MNWSRFYLLLAAVVATMASTGCGTTRWTDSARTATEQLLISDAIDQAVSQLDLSALSGQEVFFDSQYLKGAVDENYLISTLRQHLLASGCVLKESRENAQFVVEARSGGIGTDRNDVMLGVPSVNVPGFVPGSVALPSSIPEIPLAKNTHQRGVAKIAVFAFNRETGKPVWQSGLAPVTSYTKDSWVLGAGPFRKSSVDPKTKFVGDMLPLGAGSDDTHIAGQRVPLDAEAIFPSGLEPKPADPPAAAETAAASPAPPQEPAAAPATPPAPAAPPATSAASVSPSSPPAVPVVPAAPAAAPATPVAASLPGPHEVAAPPPPRVPPHRAASSREQLAVRGEQ